jgi:uncharacterized protein (DUF362 family)
LIPGKVSFDKVGGAEDLRRSLRGILPASDTVIVKPNWYSPHPANYTDAYALGLLMDAVDARFIVAEGYSLDRQDGSLKYTVDGEKVNWRWIMNHPDWDWILEGKRLEQLKAQDRWFLDSHGFTDVMREHDAEYVNVSEEIWMGRALNPSEVKIRVESMYSPTNTKKVYGFMPRKLAEHRGSTLISLSRAKGYGGTYPSFTVKNLFGFIPDPMRSWWHGQENNRLTPSILDAAKLYASYFRLYGVCEAFRNITVNDPKGEVKAPWGSYRVKEVEGFAVHGSNLVEVDAVTCGLMEVDPDKVGYIAEGEKLFGSFSREMYQKAVEERRRFIPSLEA